MGKRRLTVAACAVTGVLALAACGTGTPGGSSGSGASAAFNAGLTGVVNPSSAKGGTLSFAMSSTPDSFDPGNTYYAWVWDFSRLYATPLLTYKSCPGKCGDAVVPGIATGLGTSSDNGLAWTYHLKQGLKFEDGEPVTAQDVKYAVERTYDKSVLPNGPSYFQNLLQDSSYPGPYKDKSKDKLGLTSVTTPDNYTIQFHLAKPFPDFDYLVTIPQTAPVPPGKDTGANYQLHPLSSGPYAFKSYQLNSQATLVPNPNWTQDEDPQAKQLASKITIKLNQNADDIDSSELSGSLDVDAAGTGVQAAARARVLSSPKLKAESDDPETGFEWFAYLNTKVAPLTNVNCRIAVEYAANKTDAQTAYGGPYAGGAIASTVMPPSIVGYKSFDLYEATTDPTGDLGKAKAALKACGQPNGFTTGIAYRSDRPQEVAAAQALQASVARVGIKLQMHGYPTGTYGTDFAGVPAYVHQHDLGIDMGGWGPDWPDGYGFLYSLVDGPAIVPAGNSNIEEENDPAVNNLITQAAASGSASAEVPYWSKIDEQVMKDAAILPLTYSKALLYRSPKVTNVYVESPFGLYNYAVLGVTGSGSS
jgi:peptide/nickel transport system substrate-binding protein